MVPAELRRSRPARAGGIAVPAAARRGRAERSPALDLLDGLDPRRRRRRRPGELRRRPPPDDRPAERAARRLRARARAALAARDPAARHLPRHAGHERRRAAGRCTSTCPTSSATTSTARGRDVRRTTRCGWRRAGRSRRGEELHATKSHHHQGVDALGEGFVVTGWSAIDELPEAIEDPGQRFALGVQWHPEADETSAADRRAGGGCAPAARDVGRVLPPQALRAPCWLRGEPARAPGGEARPGRVRLRLAVACAPNHVSYAVAPVPGRGAAVQCCSTIRRRSTSPSRTPPPAVAGLGRPVSRATRRARVDGPLARWPPRAARRAGAAAARPSSRVRRVLDPATRRRRGSHSPTTRRCRGCGSRRACSPRGPLHRPGAGVPVLRAAADRGPGGDVAPDRAGRPVVAGARPRLHGPVVRRLRRAVPVRLRAPGSRIDLRASYQITMASLAATRLFAAGGAGGIALTAWALRRSGWSRARSPTRRSSSSA